MVEAPTPYQGPIGNVYGTNVLIKLGLNFNHDGTNNVMTRVLVLSDRMTL